MNIVEKMASELLIVVITVASLAVLGAIFAVCIQHGNRVTKKQALADYHAAYFEMDQHLEHCKKCDLKYDANFGWVYTQGCEEYGVLHDAVSAAEDVCREFGCGE